MAKVESSCVVYWLKDERCICPWRHGYIGISQRLSRRLSAHRLNGAIPSNFEFQVLFVGTTKECRTLEFAFRPKPSIGWNKNIGGGRHGLEKQHTQHSRNLIGNAHRGKILSEETKEKLRVANLGKLISAKTREKISVSGKGRIHNNEAIAKMRRAAIERNKDPAYIARMAQGVKAAFANPEARAKLSASLMGHEMSKETKQKISKSLIGRVRTEASKAKQGATMRGIPKSADQRAKMAEARRQWWAKKNGEV